MSKINVQGAEINIINTNDGDFISLTNMVANHVEGTKLIEKWLTNKSTIEFLGIWEQLSNENFNSPEFGGIMAEAGTNRFYMSIKQWTSRTNAIGIKAKTGSQGGTYAHRDIAFNFGLYISPTFNLTLIKEFQRLKEEESKNLGGQWDFRRFAAKVNLKIQTDAVKDILIPSTTLPIEKQGLLYAEASDVIYLAMFGYTAREWREKNPELANKGMNIRDYATSHQLIILANLENIDALLIRQGITDKKTRILELRRQATSQINILRSSHELQHALVESPNMPKKSIQTNSMNNFDTNLKGLLNTPPPKK